MNALILVDMQMDFMPGGALAVPEGDLVVPLANRLMTHFELVVATQDWHPADHGSFASQHAGKQTGDVIDLEGLQQILWPDHCVQGTPGARLHPALDPSRLTRVFPKGMDPRIDSYSGFFDNGHRQATGLAAYLQQHDVRQVTIMGLATDYCVKFTAIDSIGIGFKTRLVADGCRGVDVTHGDVDRAIDEMRNAGVDIVHAVDLAATE